MQVWSTNRDLERTQEMAVAWIWLVVAALSSVRASSDVARRSQRDVSQNQTIDQLTFAGVNLNAVLWDSAGYTTDTVPEIAAYLATGAGILEMDLYWNEQWRNWQLCPEPLLPNVSDYTHVQTLGDHRCQLGLNLSVVFGAINDYFGDTDTVKEANVVALFFNVKSLNSDYHYGVGTGDRSLSGILNSSVQYLYTPSDLQDDIDSGIVETFPTARYMMYYKYKRALTIVLSDELFVNSTYGKLDSVDAGQVFVNGYNVNVSQIYTDDVDLIVSTADAIDEIETLSNKSFRMVANESSDSTTAELQAFVNNGYSAVVRSEMDSQENVVNFLNNSLWSWDDGQPDVADPITTKYSNISATADRSVAYRCAVFYEGRWIVDNCYNTRPVACKHDNDAFNWTVLTDTYTYFKAASEYCPENFSFGVPKSSLENLALQEHISMTGLNSPVWIDMNSVSASDCWISGGPYATCPYEAAVTKELFEGMMGPAAVVVAILLGLIIAIRFEHTPIQKNRRYWKRLVNESNEKDYDGVPS